MQKALVQRPLQVSQALSEVTGDTGPRIIRAIVAGERDPQPLADVRNSRCKQDAQDIALALTGTWRAEHLCGLTQALALCAVSTAQLRACAVQIARTCAVSKPHCAPAPTAPVPAGPPPPPRRKPHAHSQHPPAVDTRAPILRLTGVDRIAVYGSSDARAQTILAEMGTAMRTGPDEQHVCAWLGLAPKHDSAGGTVRKSRTMKHRNRATHAFRMAAQSVSRSHWAFGAFSRRMQGRLGPAQALGATAHKIARTVSHLLKHRGQSHDIGETEYNQPFRERARRYVQKKAAQLGYTLSPA
jgi:transposase